MKKSLKGALLSALVYPGVGQLWLRCYLRGIALIVLVSACLAFIVRKAGQQAFAILERMESEGSSVDMVALLKSASRAPDDATSNWISALLLLCWIIGTVDAYLAGKKKDRAEHASGSARPAKTLDK